MTMAIDDRSSLAPAAPPARRHTLSVDRIATRIAARAGETSALRRRLLVLPLALVAIVLASVGCGSADDSRISEATQKEIEGRRQVRLDLLAPYDKPESLGSWSLERYESELRTKPLLIDPNHMDLSASAAARDGSWLVGLYYFKKGGKRDIYALFSNNDLYRIAADDMTLSWAANIDFRPRYAPVVSDSYIWFVTGEPRLMWYFRDKQPNNEQKKWENSLHFTPTSPPAANDQGAYLGAAEFFRVYAYNDRYLREKWYWPEVPDKNGRIDLTPQATDSVLLFYGADGYMYGVQTVDGRQSWKFPDRPMRMTGDFRLKTIQIKREDGRVDERSYLFLGSWNTQLHVLDVSGRVRFSIPVGEPIVDQPFVMIGADGRYYIYFQTPRSLMCYRASFITAGNNTLLRPATPEEIEAGRRPEDPVWTMPLVSGGSSAGDAAAWTDDARRNIKVLMLGRKWLYLLETKPDPATGKTTKTLWRVNNSNGEVDSRGYDMSMFAFILPNDDENNPTIYVGTYEGHIFGLTDRELDRMRHN